MSYTVSDLQLARRHVREGAERIARQRALLAYMSRHELPLELAENLLGLLEQTQTEFERHLGEIELQVSGS